ncbi:MAG: hypothetical protein SF097_22310 [Acidobacteriota bacterium]|nr:hypothetical protein [Acidobacteriota bacterium]
MFCPACGQQPTTEQTKFCTHCGCALDTVREVLTTGLPPGSIRQRDITLGAGLMFIGALKGLLLTTGFNLNWQGYVLLTGIFFGLLQLFFQLSPRQKGLSLGATLMFLASAVAMLAGSVTEGFGVLLVMMIAIPMILFWQKLSTSFRKTFFDKTDYWFFRPIPPAKPAAALPLEQSESVDTNRVWQPAQPQPASVTEHTTKTLGENRSVQI